MRLPQSLNIVWKKSWTKLWAYAQMIGGLLLGGVSEASTYLSNDSVSGYLHMMSVPNWVFVSIAALGLVTFIAHGRD